MATSRTGTTTWKTLRKRAIYRAKRAGLTHCPSCKVELNYDVGQTPTSAEVDHILPFSKGGQDHIDNVTVICRLCNVRKGNKAAPTTPTINKGPIRASRAW
jgi:5-methylcytosine-specific restriction enzyme A